ncbi:MAG: inositol monophosphatase [Lewinellaceae bacterium]|nr:inositol monophosphatase [Lewinellaceae bacterium]
MSKEDLEQICRRACAAVQETADFIKGEAGKVSGDQIEEKFLNGLVSYVDRTAEKMLVEHLSAILPGSTFITEEETVSQSAGNELEWIIDPLDGTTNFLYGLPQYSVSVALRVAGDLVIGIVHHVPQGEIFYAWKGGGAWCNGQPISVSKRSEMSQALIATGFPYHNFDRAEGWFAAIRKYMENCRGLRRFGSAALDLAWVACGRFEVFFEYGLNDWDVAAGVVLVEEAGGKVSDFSGGASYLPRRELLASNEKVFEAALEVVKSSFK